MTESSHLDPEFFLGKMQDKYFMESVDSLKFGNSNYQLHGGLIFAKKLIELMQDMSVIQVANRFTEDIYLQVKSIRNCKFDSVILQSKMNRPKNHSNAKINFIAMHDHQNSSISFSNPISAGPVSYLSESKPPSNLLVSRIYEQRNEPVF